MMLAVPAVGFEPTRACAQWCLRPSRIPFRHAGFGPMLLAHSLAPAFTTHHFKFAAKHPEVSPPKQPGSND